MTDKSPVWRRPESVLVVIYTPTDTLLLKRNADFEFWQSVTGSLEANELPAEAAQRELLEETGITCNQLVDCRHYEYFDISERWRHRYAPDVRQNKEHVFLCPLESKVPVLLSADEHTGYVWLKHAEALIKASSATNRAAIQQFVIEG